MRAWKVAVFAALALLLTVLTGGQAHARWIKAETRNFVLYTDGEEAALREYAEKLEKFDLLLRARHGIKASEGPTRKLPVYLIKHRDLRRMYPGASSDLMGFYSATSGTILAVAVRAREDDAFLLHEYVHHFMLQHAPYGYPGWLVEGYAEYFMTTDIREQWIDVGRFHENRAANLLRLSWPNLTDVLRSRPGAFRDAEDREAYYGLSWLLTHYFMSDPERHKQLVRYMRAVGEEGTDPVAAMQAVTGTPVSSLERRLHTYLRGGLRYERQTVKPLEVVARVEALPASADDLLLELELLRRGVAKEAAPGLLDMVKRRAARHRGDALAELALALAEIRLGDRATGEAMLRRRVTASPQDAEALELLAISLLDTADKNESEARALRTEARRLLARAYKADPSRYQTLYALARSRFGEPDYPTDNDLEALMAALELAPQVGTIRLGTAEAWLKRDRPDWAVNLLPPLANSPHGGASGERARTLLADARAKVKPAPAAPPR